MGDCGQPEGQEVNLSHVQEGSVGETRVGGSDSEELAEETVREPVWERPERGLLRVHFFAGWLLERCLSARMLRQKQPPSFIYLATSIRGIFIKCLLCIRHWAKQPLSFVRR